MASGNSFFAKSMAIRKDVDAETPQTQPFEAKHLKYGLVTALFTGVAKSRQKSPWWNFYHLYKDQASVQQLHADNVFACCNFCGKDISCGNKVGAGGLMKHIKSKHEGQLKFVPSSYGGTLDVDIDATIRKKRKAKDGDLKTMWTNSSQSMAERKEQQLETTALYLAMENVATDVVESKYFRGML